MLLFLRVIASTFVDLHDPATFSNIRCSQDFVCIFPYRFTLVPVEDKDIAHHVWFSAQPNINNNIHSLYLSSSDANLSAHSISELFIPHFEPTDSKDSVGAVPSFAEKKILFTRNLIACLSYALARRFYKHSTSILQQTWTYCTRTLMPFLLAFRWTNLPGEARF